MLAESETLKNRLCVKEFWTQGSNIDFVWCLPFRPVRYWTRRARLGNSSVCQGKEQDMTKPQCSFSAKRQHILQGLVSSICNFHSVLCIDVLFFVKIFSTYDHIATGLKFTKDSFITLELRIRLTSFGGLFHHFSPKGSLLNESTKRWNIFKVVQLS